MKREKLELTEADGYAALRGHVVERALLARARHGSTFDEEGLRALFADPEVMRFPTRLAFGEEGLLPGEFAWARPDGAGPGDGFTLVVHPWFEERWDVVPLLALYHVVSINYLDVATHEEAELYGSTLLDLDREDYYARLCELADSIPGAPVHDPLLAQRFESAVQGASAVGGSCSGGCGGGCSK